MYTNLNSIKILLRIVRSTTLSELCVRRNGSASAMCGWISPLGVFVRFGTMQVAGCRSGLAPDGGFGRLAGSSFADNPVLQLLNSRAVHSRYASLHYIAFASPETALHRRGLVLGSVFFVVFFYPELFVSNVAYPRAALIRACVLSHLASTCFPARGLNLFAPFLFFAEDFSACAAFESAPVASGLRPSASWVRFLPVGSFPVAVPIIRGRVFKWSPPSIRGISASDNLFTSTTLVGSPVAAVRFRLTSMPFRCFVQQSCLRAESVH